jgi:hypothetical protein
LELDGALLIHTSTDFIAICLLKPSLKACLQPIGRNSIDHDGIRLSQQLCQRVVLDQFRSGDQLLSGK